MMKGFSRQLLLCAAAGWFVFGLQSALAQEPVDANLLKEVANAFEATRAVSSFHLSVQSATESAGSSNGMSLNSQQAQEFDLVRTESGWNAQGTMTISLTLPFGVFDIAEESVVVDGVTYLRFTEVPSGLPLNLPVEWVKQDEFIASLNTDGETSPETTTPGAASVDDLLAPLNLPFTGDSITELKLLPDTELDGMAMKVYQVTPDTAAVLASDAASLLNAGMGMAGALPAGFNPGSMNLPGNMPQMPDSALTQPSDPNNIQITIAVYVGQEDGRIHRIYSVMESAAGTDAANPMPGATITTIRDFSAFDQPVTITAPDL